MKPVPMADSYKCVSAYWSSGEGWNWSSLAGLLPNQIEDLLHVVLLRQYLEGRDNICWGFTNDGRFTIKSAYLSTLTCNCSHPSIEWKRICKLQDPQRIRTFLWLIHHRKIMTNLERARRGFTANSYCQACPTSIEDLDHVFRFYTTTATLWKKIGDMERTTYPQNMTFMEWFSWNLNEPTTTFTDGEWRVFFAICIWLIWKWRNECTFNGSKIPLETKIATIYKFVNEVRAATSTQMIMHGGPKTYRTSWVGCSPPPQGWVTLNTDGCYKKSINQAGGGGIFKKHRVHWIC